MADDINEYLDQKMLLIRTQEKFAAKQNISPMPKFKEDYEYVDYALHVLGETMIMPFKAFPNFLKVSRFAQVKSAKRSVDARNTGNTFYKDKEFDPAHHHYTRSISLAPFGSVELALAYGNRSAVLFKLKLFKECIEDIEQAIANNYPKEKQAKLRLRQRQAKKLLPKQDKTPYHGPLPEILNKNSSIPTASDCIEVKKDQEFGRHIVAAKEIKPGQVLLAEKPYAVRVKVDVEYIFCSECLEVCYNLIPCEKCRLLYCSTVCRKKAFVDYHRYECAILRHFGLDLINWTAVRMTLKGAKAYKEYSQLFTSEYSTNKNEKDVLLRAAVTAKVFYVLKEYTNFFSEFDIDDNENVFKTMYLKNLNIYIYNGFNVPVHNEMHQVTVIGRAIYPTLSLYNHACNQNVMAYFCGSTAVLRATCRIKQGEQCFINYGANPSTTLREQRRRHLEETFKFICKCQACVENWPITEVTLTLPKGKLIDELIDIHRVIFSRTKINDRNKQRMLQRTFDISEVLKSEAAFLLYKYTNPIFGKLLSDGNYLKSDLFFGTEPLHIFIRNLILF